MSIESRIRRASHKLSTDLFQPATHGSIILSLSVQSYVRNTSRIVYYDVPKATYKTIFVRGARLRSEGFSSHGNCARLKLTSMRRYLLPSLPEKFKRAATKVARLFSSFGTRAHRIDHTDKSRFVSRKNSSHSKLLRFYVKY